MNASFASARRHRRQALAVLVAFFSLLPITFGQAQPKQAPYVQSPLPTLKGLPSVVDDARTPEELKAIQDRVEIITRNALPAIVNIQITTVSADGEVEGEQGSGIIVSKDGYILTAGHVSGDPGRPVTLVLSNGTRLGGITLGANSLYDSGMIKITSRTNVDFPFMPVGSVSKMKAGDWVIAMGHPGGLQRGRAPVVRLGKVLTIVDHRDRWNGDWFIQTDCPLIMGDSGGPVFDLNGQVIAINSKIGISTTSNIHVPIDTFEETWDRLADSEKWGPSSNPFAARPVMPPPQLTQTPPSPPKATLGAVLEGDGSAEVQSVRAGMAAERVGIMPGDTITKLDTTIVKGFDDIAKFLASHKPGETVTLELQRNGKSIQVKVTLDAADSR